jgi:hypothetical protein
LAIASVSKTETIESSNKMTGLVALAVDKTGIVKAIAFFQTVMIKTIAKRCFGDRDTTYWMSGFNAIALEQTRMMKAIAILHWMTVFNANRCFTSSSGKARSFFKETQLCQTYR